MRTGMFVLALLGACSFRSHEIGDGGPTDVPAIDSPKAGDGSGSGSGSGSATGAFRKSLTIDKANIKGNNADFPVWIDLTDADIASRAQTDGSDIFFTDATGNVLDHELVRFNRNTQRVLAWVRVPALNMNASTVLYVVYGDPSRAVAQNPPGVFKSSYGAVWHLDDALSATAIADATGTHAGTATGLTPASSINGQLGPGIAFDGSGTHSIAFTNMLTGNNAHTISAWVNQAQTANHSPVVVIGTNTQDHARFMYANYLNEGTIGVGQYSDDWVPAGNDLRAQGWKYEVYTLEGSNKQTHVFIDGIEIVGSPHMMMSAVSTTTSSGGLIGAAPSGFLAAEMDGSLDEVRISTVARSATWIATEFTNQKNPTGFYAVGAEEPAP